MDERPVTDVLEALRAALPMIHHNIQEDAPRFAREYCMYTVTDTIPRMEGVLQRFLDALIELTHAYDNPTVGEFIQILDDHMQEDGSILVPPLWEALYAFHRRKIHSRGKIQAFNLLNKWEQLGYGIVAAYFWQHFKPFLTR
jgi:hypothetical protein